MPLALGGALVLPDASCTSCQRTINEQFEGKFLQEQAISARAFLNLPTRSKSRPPSGRLTEIGQVDADGDMAWDHTTWSEAPKAYMAISYQPPFFLTGAPAPETGVPVGMRIIEGPGFEERLKELGATPTIPVGLRHQFSPDGHAREIAKIGHGAAVALFGFGSFDPFLPDTILGVVRFCDLFKYVGSASVLDAHVAEIFDSELHSLCIAVNENMLIIVTIRLFALIGAPSYVAVAGRLKKADALSQVPLMQEKPKVVFESVTPRPTRRR